MRKRKNAVKNLRKRASIARNVLKFSTFLILFISNYSFAQSTRIGVNGTLNQFDVFHGIEVDYQALEHISFQSSFQLGVRKTYAQGRIFPRIGIGGMYWIPVVEKFSIAPTVTLGLSWLKISKSTKDTHRFEEYLLGVTFNYGEKWQLRQTTSMGYINERFQSGLENKLYRAGGFGYNLTLGIYYAL